MNDTAQVEDAIMAPLRQEWARLKYREVILQRLESMGVTEALSHLPNVAEYVASLESRLAKRNAAFAAMREALIDTMEQVEYATLRLNSAIKADARVPGNAPFVVNTTKARVALALADQTTPQKETL